MESALRPYTAFNITTLKNILSASITLLSWILGILTLIVVILEASSRLVLYLFRKFKWTCHWVAFIRKYREREPSLEVHIEIT
jgi:hypothetical protein